MDKKQKLEKLDALLLDKMIELIEDGELEELGSLSVAVSYVSKNNLVEDKKLSTNEDAIAERLKKAQARRKAKA